MTRKISIIAIAIIILVSLIISIYIPNREKIEETENTSISYYVIEKDGKKGVTDGVNLIIEPKYDEIIIPNPHRTVFRCINGYDEKFVDENDVEIFKEFENVELIQINNEEYEKNILIYEKDEKLGLLGITGKTVTEPKYEEIFNLGYKEGEVIVKYNGKYGIIDEKGNTKIKNEYDSIQSDEYYTEENGYKKSGYILQQITDSGYRYGYYDYEGMQVLAEEYNQITRLTQIKSDDIYLIAAKNGQYGVFINNSKIINTQYQSIDYNSDLGMFIVERTGKFGAINLKGTKILEPEYSELTISGIFLYGVNDEQKKVFNENGEEVEIPFDTVITSTSNPKYFIRNDAGNYSIANANFEKITNQNYKFIEHAYDTYFIVTNQQDKVGVIDINEKIVVDFNYDLIQPMKGKNIIQAIDFSTNKTDIYDNEFDLALEMYNVNIEIIDDGIRVYNDEQENFLDNNGKIITK